MTRTFDGPPARRPSGQAGIGPAAPNTTSRSTWGERAIVLGGFAIAALLDRRVACVSDGGMETDRARSWIAAIAWAVVFSLALALRRGIRRRDWSAFRRYRLSGNGDVVDWSTRTGAYAYMRVAEEHERLMRGD